MAEKLGALSSLNRDEYDKLSLGVQGQNSGTDIFGYNVTPSNMLTGAVGMFTGLGTPMALGSAIGNYQAEQSADKLLGNASKNLPASFMNAVTIGGGDKNTGVNQVRGFADINGDGRVTNYEMNQFGQKIPGLDLAPMYSGGNTNKMVPGYRGRLMPSDAVANPYSSRDLTQMMNTPESKYVSQDYIDDNLKSSKDFAGDGIRQSNVIGMEGYDKNFADAVTRESQGGGGGGGPTYICTALYEMGDMKKYIYKYDQVYGKRVDPNVYRGYCVWGKYVATKLRHKGIVYKIAKPLALAWAKQMAFDLSKGRYGKNSKVVKVISKIGEGVCYALGVIANIKFKKGVRYG